MARARGQGGQPNPGFLAPPCQKTVRAILGITCEVYSRILVLGATRRERLRLVEEDVATALPSDAQVETGELVEIL